MHPTPLRAEPGLRAPEVGRRLAATGGAALLVLVAAQARLAAGTPEAGEPRVWVADRDGGRVVALDEALRTVREVVLPWPTRLAPAAGGGIWASCAVEGGPDGAHRLVRLDGGGGVREVHGLGRVLDSCAGLGGEIWVLEAPGVGPTQLRRFRVGRPPDVVLAAPGLCAVAAADRGVAVSDERGTLRLAALGRPVDPLAWRQVSLEGVATSLAPGADGGWWALLGSAGTGAACASRLSSEGETLGSIELPLRSPVLAAPAPGGPQRPWIASGTGRGLVRLSQSGGAARAGEAPQGCVAAAVGLHDGGLLLATSGAVLELDRTGRLVRSQGGFEGLADLVALRW